MQVIASVVARPNLGDGSSLVRVASAGQGASEIYHVSGNDCDEILCANVELCRPNGRHRWGGLLS